MQRIEQAVSTVSDWSKVLSAMTRWMYSNARRYDKEPEKYTQYGQFLVKSTYKDLYVYRGRSQLARVHRGTGDVPVLSFTLDTKDFEKSLCKWEAKFKD